MRPSTPNVPQAPLLRGELRDAIYSTDEYYQVHAESYFTRTVSADLSHLYERFLPNIVPGGRILDIGCGSGRDLREFVRKGFRPVGIDQSKALVELARSFSGADCEIGRVEEMMFDRQFDGVWACASLLHLPRALIDRALARIRNALIPGGAFFASVQEGDGERISEDGRFYTFYRQGELLDRVETANFDIFDCWFTQDVLDEGRSIRWLNVLAKARGGSR